MPTYTVPKTSLGNGLVPCRMVFQGAEEAQLVGQEVFEKYSKAVVYWSYWVVAPTSRELSRNLIDLQQPITKPWTIELPIEEDLTTASTLLPKFIEHIDFSYLSQRFDRETNKLQFRIRVGFLRQLGKPALLCIHCIIIVASGMLIVNFGMPTLNAQ